MRYITQEQELLAYVYQNAKQNDITSIINTIDQFGWNQKWLMCVGDAKGDIYEQEIKKSNSKVGLELGVYCGYSGLRAIRGMGKSGRLYSVDPNKQTNKIAQSIFEYAGISDQIVLFQGIISEAIPVFEKQNLVFDHISIDHLKELYLQDLIQLENSKLMRKGTLVVADNILFFNRVDYLDHINDKTRYTQQANHELFLEYSKQDKDSIHVAYKL